MYGKVVSLCICVAADAMYLCISSSKLCVFGGEKAVLLSGGNPFSLTASRRDAYELAVLPSLLCQPSVTLS